MKQSEVKNIDCMIGMKQYPDKFFDLAVVDPPYGIGESKKQRGKNAKPCATWKNRANTWVDYVAKDWDEKIPDENYFDELFRISKNQIVWGGNYFNLPPTKCVIIWDKLNGETDFADGEFAWSSYDKALRIFKYLWSGYKKQIPEERFHPTQKPVALYSWVYKNYLPDGGKVIDTHLGSGSNRIAADKAGNIDFIGFELDKDYYEAQEKRWKNYKMQLNLFA